MIARLLQSAHLRRSAQVAIDAALVALAFYLAFVLRFDGGIPERYENLLVRRSRAWCSASCSSSLCSGSTTSSGASWTSATSRRSPAPSWSRAWRWSACSSCSPPAAADPPRGVIALDFLICLIAVGGSRFVVRSLVERPLWGTLAHRDAREVLIVGAGNGGQLVAVELRRNPELRKYPIGFVDDDPRKQGMRMAGLKVLGTTDELARVLDDSEPDEVVIAIPSAPGVVRQRVVTACRARGIPVRTLPTVFELLSGGVELMRQVREVRVEDVLGREPVRMEIDRVGAYLRDEVVLVTGAGGSIGSELCRQIARVGPERLVLLDNAENNLFEIRRELEDDRHFNRPCRSWPTARTRCAWRRSSPSTVRRWSSTPPPTSTCR